MANDRSEEFRGAGEGERAAMPAEGGRGEADAGLAGGTGATSAEGGRSETDAGSTGGVGATSAEAMSTASRARAGIGTGEARLSFQRQRVTIEAIEAGDTITLKVDARRVAPVAHSVALRDAAPARRAVFERLAAAGFYRMATLDDLPHAARAAWYARRQYLYTYRETSGASVPEETVREAYATRARMQRVLAYWFGDDDEKIGARLRSIREGSGRLDLASALEELGGLYARDDVKRVLEGEKKHYRASDAADAVRLAGALFGGLGVGEETESARWASLSQRANTLLVRTYDEHRRCGQFAFGRDEDVDATYPSLIGAARGAAAKRPAVEAPADDDDETPVDGE